MDRYVWMSAERELRFGGMAVSRVVTIEVNPYWNRTRWDTQGDFFEDSGRLTRYLNGRPMSSWLRPCRESYQLWNGFLAEMMRAFNEDELEFHFIGTREDCTYFRRELALQREEAERQGYSSEKYTVSFAEKFSPAKVREELRTHRKRTKGRTSMIPPSQQLLLRMDALDTELFDAAPAEIASLARLYSGYAETYEACAETCETSNRSSWLQRQSELKQIFERG